MKKTTSRPLFACKEALHERTVHGVFLHARKDKPLPLGFPEMKKFLALSRLSGTYWVFPTFGEKPEEIPPETQLLLWETSNGGTGLLLPLPDSPSQLRASLRGGTDGPALVFDGAEPGSRKKHTRIIAAYISRGQDPFALLEASFEAVRDRLGTFRLRKEKRAPGFLRTFGWCTWDAFYTGVTEAGVLRGLASFRKGKVSPGFMILDDGWQDTTGDLLNSFEPDTKKFPSGLSGLIRKAKTRYGIRTFGVWHNFMGYWAGINPSSSLGRAYPPIANKNSIRPWENPQRPLDLFLVPPDRIADFYSSWHARMRSEGVDMVKTDGQSALELFTAGKTGRVGAMQKYQYAMQGSAATQFLGETIHCMSHGTDVLFHLSSSSVIRNSNDYMPSRPAETQKDHIRNNAMNTLWTSGPGLPDWDMFQSRGPLAEYHAAARAVSGGPVYVSDKPGEHDFALLKRLMTPDGAVLLCDGPALPARDCLFTDTSRIPVPLKIWNHSGRAGILGLFHCLHAKDPVSGMASSRDIPGLSGEKFCVWSTKAKSLRTVRRNERIPVELKDSSCEIMTFFPLEGRCVPLGLIDKFNPAPAILSCIRTGKNLTVTIRSGGRAGFWCAEKPSACLAGGRRIKYAYDASQKLLTASLPGTGKPVSITIRF